MALIKNVGADSEAYSSYNYEELLIDGDLLVFSSCAAAEYGKLPSDYTMQEILSSIESRIHNMKKRLRAKKVRLFFSGSNNFRHVIAPSYKANRASSWRPETLKDAIEHCMVMFKGERVNGLEADDLLAANQKTDGTTIIATLDKDIPQVRGMHYRWETKHRGEEVFEVTGTGELINDAKNGKSKIRGNGVRFFAWQLLTGDPTDGVMGCGKLEEAVYKSGAKAGEVYLRRVGVGAVEAFNLLEHAITYQRCMEIVMAKYKEVFGDDWEEELLRNGRCLYMVNKIRDDGKFLLWHYKPEELVNSWYDPSKKAVVSLRG